MILGLERVFTYVYYAVMWRTFKWLMRLFTGRCELLRITLTEHNQLQRTRCIEASLTHSRHEVLRRTLKSDGDVDILTTIATIVNLKGVKVEKYPEFSQRLQRSVNQIVGYHRLINEVETLRRIPYSSENPDHESQLTELWNALRPDTPLESRVGRQWSEIGFQGDDPATDFRGMGLLGLSNLLFLATRYNDVAKQLMSHSEHPQFGYSFAIAGINITSVGWKLLLDGRLKSHFYHSQSIPQMDDFHFVYVYLFYEFDKFWLAERPVDIMQFNVVKNKFVEEIIRRLESTTAPLEINLNADQRRTVEFQH